jgi:metal-sulfur cluster biosynthetic enzyme
MPSTEEIIEKLKEVKDPHTNSSVYDMGLISDLEIGENRVTLTFTPTSAYCPLGIQLAGGIKKSLKGLGIKEVNVRVKGHIQEEQLNELLKEM